MKGPVICGIDDSNGTVRAAGVARELAQRHELPLLYVHVLDGHRRNSEAKQPLHTAAVPAHAEVAIESGHPADRLVALACERQASIEGGIVRFGLGHTVRRVA